MASCHFNDLVCESSKSPFDTAAVAELAEHIRKNGHLFPLEVKLVNFKFVVPLRQAHRFEAIKSLGEEFWSNIPIKVEYT